MLDSLFAFNPSKYFVRLIWNPRGFLCRFYKNVLASDSLPQHSYSSPPNREILVPQPLTYNLRVLSVGLSSHHPLVASLIKKVSILM